MGATQFLKDIVRNLKFSDESRVRRVTDTDLYHTKLILEGATLFTCKTKDQTSLDEDPVWQIKAATTAGEVVTARYGDDGRFTQKISERLNIFPFTNQKSVQFDGVNDFLSTPDDTTFNIFVRDETFSFAFWVKSTDTGTFTLFSKQDGGTGMRLYHETGSNAINFTMRTGNNNRILVVEGGTEFYAADDEWQFCVVTFDGSSLAAGLTFYRNGVIIPGFTVSNDTLTTDMENPADFTLAAQDGGAGNFDGKMDEISIWDMELTAADVTRIYNLGVPIDLLSDEAALDVVYWLRAGDSLADDPDNLTLSDVKKGLVATMNNMLPTDVQSDVPGGP